MFAGKFEREDRLRIPRAGPLKLIDRPVVETTEPPRDLRVEPPLLRGCPLEPVLSPLVRTRGNHNAGCHLKRCGQAFACGIRIELHAVAAAKPPVDRRPEDPVTLPA